MCPAEPFSGGSRRDASEQTGTGSDLLEPDRVTSSIVDVLATPLAVLDEAGVILRANDAWRALDEAASPLGGATTEGTNCLWACDVAEGAGTEEAKAIAAGIRAVASSEQSGFALGYSRRSADENRCFVVRARGFAPLVPFASCLRSKTSLHANKPRKSPNGCRPS